MSVKEIAILGAGNGGITAAADLTLKGYNVRLFELKQFSGNLKPLSKQGGVLFKEKSVEEFVPLNVLTTDIKEAVQGADVIMIVVPALVIEQFAEVLAPHLEDDQIVFINNAASMASVRFVNKIKELNIDTKFKVAESGSLTYGTRVQDGVIELYLRVQNLLFSAYPSSDTDELLPLFQKMYPGLVKASNVWETTLNNGNPETHPGPSLLNAGRIEYSKGEFYLYKEGITDGVINVINSITQERKKICESIGVAYLDPVNRLVQLGYCEADTSLKEQYNNSKVFSNIKGPLSLKSRYFAEDISMGLVLWSSIGRALNIDTPVIDSIVTLGGSLLGEDFWSTGLTLEKLSLSVNDSV